MIIIQRDLRKISILILSATFLSFALAFAETAEEHLNRGNASNDPDEAIAEYTRAIELNPNYVEAYNERGFAYECDKRTYGQAIADFTKAIQLDPNYTSAYINRSAVYDSIGEYDKAIADFTKVIEIEPDYPRRYSNMALFYFHKGDYDKAWENVHKSESSGDQVYPSFLEQLKKASGREN
jgi:tetratricopeptide (TPR) repeat protein